MAQDNESRDAPCVGAGWFGVVAGWVAGAGSIACVVSRGRPLPIYAKATRSGEDLAGLAGVLRDLGTPYICACPKKRRADSKVPSSRVMARLCTPLSIPAICCAGSANPCSTRHVAMEHLTRSRAASPIPGTFSCGFLSWSVREVPPASLYAIPARGVAQSASRSLRLQTSSGSSLSAIPALSA